MFDGDEASSVPTGGLPNNGIVVALIQTYNYFTFAFQCRSGSMTDILFVNTLDSMGNHVSLVVDCLLVQA